MWLKKILAILGVVASLLVISSVFVERKSEQLGWEEIRSAPWEFSGCLPSPVEHQVSAVETPYGNAPLESFAGVSGSIRFTIAVAEYDPLITVEFTEEERYDSAAVTTPKMLNGNLLKHSVIYHGDLTGREQIIDVPKMGTLKTRAFLVRNRSYQAQIAIPNGIFFGSRFGRVFLRFVCDPIQ